MSSTQNSITWPSETLLVQRAERYLNVPRASSGALVAAAPLIQAIEAMEARWRALADGPRDLVPTGFESSGALAPLKRFVKKVTRRLVWWYVEPRWTVQRRLTEDLIAFTHASVQANLAIGTELEILRARVSEIEFESRARAT